jgi:hypothetical protein
VSPAVNDCGMTPSRRGGGVATARNRATTVGASWSVASDNGSVQGAAKPELHTGCPVEPGDRDGVGHNGARLRPARHPEPHHRTRDRRLLSIRRGRLERLGEHAAGRAGLVIAVLDGQGYGPGHRCRRRIAPARRRPDEERQHRRAAVTA